VIKLFRSTVIDAPIADVWKILRDFNGHHKWHPAISHSYIEDEKSADQIGAIRNFTLANGGAVRERLLSLSDEDYSFRYEIVESDLPISNYRAKVQLKPITDNNQTFWIWSSSFETSPEQETEITQSISKEIYEAGFQSIRDKLSKDHRSFNAVSTHQIPNESILKAKEMVISHFGGPEVFFEKDIEIPPPRSGQVRIRQLAIGVNYIDIYCRNGSFDFIDVPAVLGFEAAGEVDMVGDGVTQFYPGQRVAYACPPPGAYASARNMNASSLVLLPEQVSIELAAGALLKGMTTEILLHRVHRLQPGQTILVYAPAGGVGHLLCQWATHIGATVIGCTSSREKIEIAKKAGCHHVIVPGATGIVSQIHELTDGRGVDVILDGVGKDSFHHSIKSLGKGGHLICYGQASGRINNWDLNQAKPKSITISSPYFYDYIDSPESLKAVSDNLFQAINQGVINVELKHKYPLVDVAKAHRLLEGRQSTGSIILSSDKVVES